MILRPWQWLLVLMIFMPGSGMAMQDSVKRSMEYVDQLDHSCRYDHGYVCLPKVDDDFTGPDPQHPWTPGLWMQAFSVTYQDFLEIEEMTADQKALVHYKFGFSETQTQFIVLYQGLLLPLLEGGVPVGVMHATYGITTQYWVDKASMEIDKRRFLR